MGKTNNKVLANKWEREASRLLSNWISGGKRSDLFWRTNSSGGKFTVTRESAHAGDIVPVAGAEGNARRFGERYLLEVKRKKNFSFADLGTLEKWAREYHNQAVGLGKKSFLLIKGGYGKIYVLIGSGEEKSISGFGVPVNHGSPCLTFKNHSLIQL